jgi:hypothetical protein
MWVRIRLAVDITVLMNSSTLFNLVKPLFRASIFHVIKPSTLNAIIYLVSAAIENFIGSRSSRPVALVWRETNKNHYM